MALLDGLNGPQLLPFMSALGAPPVAQAPSLPFNNRWNPVGQLMTPADPNMQAALLAHAHQLLNPPTALPPETSPQSPTVGQGGGILPQGPMQPQAPQNEQASPAPAQGGGFWSGLSNAIAANPMTLMALGGGIMRGGLGYGLQQAVPVAGQERQQQMLLQQQAATEQALLKAGYSPQEARAGALNLQSFSALETARHQKVTEQQAATTPVKIGTDSWGSDIYAVRDPSAPSGYRRIDTSGTGAGGASPEAAATSGLTGPDYLKTLPPERQPFIEKVANYEIDPRTLSIKGGHRERTLAEVAAFRPDYNQQNYAAAQEGLKKFQSGQQGNSIRSFNTAIEHLDQLTELGAALKNGDIPTINRIKNWWQTETGSSAPTNFEGLKGIVGQEVVKAIVANGGSDRERADASNRVAAASSPEQLAGIVATYKGAMGAQLKSLKLQYEQSTLRKDFDRLLSEKAKAELARHQGAGMATGAAPGAPKPGNFTYDPATGQMAPAQ